MKKQLLLFALMLLPMVASAFTGVAEINGINYYINTDDETAVVSQKTYSRHVVIPETVEYEGVTCRVTSIGGRAFYGCTGLTSITIPESVTSIGDWAFYNTSLTSITIPNSVNNIGEGAFAECDGLASIIVENGNPIYDSRDNCNAIIRTADNVLIVGCQSTIIPNSVTSIGYLAFAVCSSLTSITIPNSVTSIGDWAFAGCPVLTSITIPNSVTSIGHNAFDSCFSLSSITIPNSVTSIGSSAFGYCGKIEDVYCFAEAVPSTNASAFNNSNIQSATLHVPEGSVSEYANTDPWSQFGSIVGMGKCATPTITYANGKVRFACDTEDVEFISTVTCTPTKLQNGSELEIGSTFAVSVYATKEGYDDSEVATKTINMSQVGDIDADGQITVSDITSLVNLLLGK